MDQDPNYRVEGVPRGIRALITRFDEAAQEYAFIGSHDLDTRAGTEEAYQIARHNLERGIVNKIEQAQKVVA